MLLHSPTPLVQPTIPRLSLRTLYERAESVPHRREWTLGKTSVFLGSASARLSKGIFYFGVKGYIRRPGLCLKTIQFRQKVVDLFLFPSEGMTLRVHPWSWANARRISSS